MKSIDALCWWLEHTALSQTIQSVDWIVPAIQTIHILAITVVAASAHRLRVPAPSLLVLAGLAIAMIPGVPAVQISPNVVSVVVLPPLLYAAGQDLPWPELEAWCSVAR